MTSNEGETNNVDANNRVTSTIEADLTTSTYTYDDDGNLIKKTYADQTSEDYQYDVWGHMTSYTNRDGVTTVYTYYADGLRKSKQTAGGDVTQYYYDGDVVINETVDGELFASNTVVGSRIVQREEAGSTEAALIYNTHGDVALVLNVNGGDPVRTYLYEAYGKVYSGYDASYNSPILYAGQYYDAESGMYYLRARYYSPDLKRFIQEDPIRDGMNWYAYCSGNPVRYVDPWGLAPTKEEAAAMADHIYDWEKDSDRSDRTVAGWRLIDVWRGRESMKMGIYIKDSDDWQNPSEYALVFRGSIIQFNSETLDVWKNNVEQFLSAKSADMWDAINYSVGFTNSHSQEITFIGHSKGGAEALAAAVATDKNAIAFNPAKPNMKDYNLSAGNYNGNATSYVVRGEILNNLFGEPSVGRVEYLNQKYKTPWYFVGATRKIANVVNPIRNHLMGAVLSGI